MNTSFSGAINEFDAYVSNTIETVEEIANALGDSYDQTALSIISKRFETIGKKYTEFTIVARDPFYDIARRSKSRFNAVKKVSQQSKSIAQLFEKYAKNPKSYSAVQSRLQINTLIAELRNLRTALPTTEIESDRNLSGSESSSSQEKNETANVDEQQPPNQTFSRSGTTSSVRSFLDQTSKRLNIKIDDSIPVDRARLFYEALLAIQNQLYQQSLGNLTRDFLSVLETDIRTIISGMKDLFLSYREIKNVQEHLEKGYSDIVVSLRILDDFSIEPDGASRVKRSTDSIMNFRKELDQAILYWPAELVREYSTNIESAQANIEAFHDATSEPPPDLPDTTTSAPSPPEQHTEPSEIISQYKIQDNALEKHAATDKPIQNIKQDRLGFGVYVTALRDFIISQYTTTPLTISVDGPWGAGKSSLMYMLKNSLEPQHNIWQRFVSWLKITYQWWKWFFWWFLAFPVQTAGQILLRMALKLDNDTEEFDFRIGKNNSGFRSLITDIAQGLSINPEVLKQRDNKLSLRAHWWAKIHASSEPMESPSYPTIWLNAWKFDNQEEVWASLALATLEQIKQKHNIFWMLWFRIRLTFGRMSFISALSVVLLQFALPLILGVVAFYYTLIIGSYDTPLKAFNLATKGYGNYLMWAGGILSGVLTVSSILKDPFQIQVGKILDRPNYKEKVTFLTTFEKDFAKIIELVTSNGIGWKKSKLVIFVDDLDRCEPPKAADIIEAINLFLDAEGCVFVIGMDSESVSKSIEVKYKDLFERMKAENAGVASLGRAFLEKIVQIPFTVPRATPGQISNMVEDTLGRNTSKGITIAQLKVKTVDDTPPDEQHRLIAQNGSTSKAKQETITGGTAADQTTIETIDPASFAREEVRQAIRLGSKLLSENPRQVKTFVNLFRLSIYIANARGFFEEGRKGEKLRLIGLDRLAIWVACSVRWQSLVRHLYEETQMGSLCEFLYDVSQNITTDHKWNTGNKNIPVKIEKKFDGLRKTEKGSEAHWCHLPWDWWLLEPDFLAVVKRMEGLWAPPSEGEIDQLKVLLNMSRPLSPSSPAEAK